MRSSSRFSGAGPSDAAALAAERPHVAAADSSEADLEAARGARYRVLIADDNVDTATAFGALIEAMGHEVYVAHDGLEALDLARRLRPDAIFLDCAMPWITGDEVCRRLRQEPWARTVLIAAATGFGSPEDRKRSFDSGFDYHLVKPIDPRLVRSLLQYL